MLEALVVIGFHWIVAYFLVAPIVARSPSGGHTTAILLTYLFLGFVVGIAMFLGYALLLDALQVSRSAGPSNIQILLGNFTIIGPAFGAFSSYWYGKKLRKV